MKKHSLVEEEEEEEEVKENEIEILKAAAQAWHGHSGNPRPTTEFGALKSGGTHKNRQSRFKIEALRRLEREKSANWDFSRSLWDSYEIVTISKKLESNLALDHPMEGGRSGKRSRESKNSLRNLFRLNSKRA